MLNKIFCILGLSLFFSISFLSANPFISTSQNQEQKQEQSENFKQVKTLQYPVVAQKIFYKITPIQRILQHKLSSSIKKFKNTQSLKTFLILLLIAFIFGVIHAIGPGHGKTVLFSYFLSNKTLFIKGIIFATVIAFMHAISSIAIVGIIAFILKKAYLTSFENISQKMQLVSYIIIILVGIFLLIKSFISLFQSKAKQEISNISDNLNFIPVALAVGLIPCPGALIILLFSLSLNVLPLGILMVLFMALGMSVTITVSSMFGLLLENKISGLVTKNKTVYAMITSGLHILGSLILISFALFMLTQYL